MKKLENLVSDIYSVLSPLTEGEALDISDKDIEEFVEQLTTEQFQNMTRFFDTMPKLRHVVEVTNPKTNVKSEVVLEGLQSFLE